ncbi:MAG: hypothetical protein OXI87_09460 [Albidovulum sp.]|nr:hypothetical protein [Albidovulum sp.]
MLGKENSNADAPDALGKSPARNAGHWQSQARIFEDPIAELSARGHVAPARPRGPDVSRNDECRPVDFGMPQELVRPASVAGCVDARRPRRILFAKIADMRLRSLVVLRMRLPPFADK